MEAGNEYVEFEPNQRVTFRNTSGPIDFEASYLAEPAPEGTRLTSTIEMHPRGFTSLAEPLIAARLGQEMEAGLDELKELLEGQAVAVSS
jgi:hypothetical protein